ncbi:MAG TPA: hypothetical protein VK607_08110 [Kofleriaceae bacterium]|nr:hypothetical protein [Kofleriaceae bacterium]
MIGGSRRAPPATDPAPGPPFGTSPFGAILRRAVQTTPGAIGGAFADEQGEMIDGFTTRAPDDWALLTAHYGIVLSQLHAAFGTWHFGGPEYFIAQHAVLDVVVHAVDGGYYALLAVLEPAPLGHALRSLRRAARELHQEML